MYDKYHKTILMRLYTLRCIGGKHTSRENTLRGFPKNERGKGKSAIDDLIKRNMIIPKITSYGEHISLNTHLIKDIKQVIDPNEKFIDAPLYEDPLNSNYEKQSFRETFGDKMIKGVKAKYAYHKNVIDPNMIMCYLSVSGIKKRNIDLGSFLNPELLLARSVTDIDFHFKGESFTKDELIILEKEIVENRQPVHAIIDMLLHFGYLDKVSKKQYARTNKKLPIPPLDSFKNLDES